MLSLRVELKTSRLLNGCSNQLSYESLTVGSPTDKAYLYLIELKVLTIKELIENIEKEYSYFLLSFLYKHQSSFVNCGLLTIKH